MQISDAVEVIEVHGHVAANEKLTEGWTLLAVIPATNPSHGAGYGVYVLGKPAAPIQEEGEYKDGDWVAKQ